jgi:hypothetical protein
MRYIYHIYNRSYMVVFIGDRGYGFNSLEIWESKCKEKKRQEFVLVITRGGGDFMQQHYL